VRIALTPSSSPCLPREIKKSKKLASEWLIFKHFSGYPSQIPRPNVYGSSTEISEPDARRSKSKPKPKTDRQHP
jgi:hypothetical protein